MRKLIDNTHAVIDLSIVLMIGIAFAALKDRVKSLSCADGGCVYHMDTKRSTKPNSRNK